MKYLVDTDIFIDFFKRKLWARNLFANRSHEIIYSSVTLKELLKGAQSSADKENILRFLHYFTEVRINAGISDHSLMLMRSYPLLKRNDALVAACALVRQVPLVTRNVKHFHFIEEITVIDGRDFM